MQDLFTRFTLDEASEFLFGETVNSLRDKDSEFITAFNYAQMITAWRFRVPFWQYFVPKRRLLREVGVLDKFVLKIINNAIARKEAKEKSGEVPSDDEKGIHHDNLLDHFLHYQTENGFSKTYLRDMLLNFMIAGRDTTASLLTWTVWYLVEHPEVAEKVYNEILSVLGSTSIPTYDDIKKLKYQKQVINEVLRLRPPVPFNMRQSVEEDVLPNGYYIPPHTIVSYSAYVTHRMTEYWGEDADKFDPDRWGPERVGSIKPFMFVPFHAGPRICLGQNLAYTTAQIALTRLLQNFVFKPVTGFEPQKFGDIVLFSRNGVEVMVEKRNPVQL
ncbi:hypothetical protein BGW38_005146 [Lunasporangiospora selenospora]|uniref:Cytochrome P450 n=1 Tax=Lunasporangiospora selenospora TaxID=979761 RepID=A0A9P6FQC6_9FUNG|nr:hypothetical protein BGW38_005146 [Lunasporangiospora selenospora]